MNIKLSSSLSSFGITAFLVATSFLSLSGRSIADDNLNLLAFKTYQTNNSGYKNIKSVPDPTKIILFRKGIANALSARGFNLSWTFIDQDEFSKLNSDAPSYQYRSDLKALQRPITGSLPAYVVCYDYADQAGNKINNDCFYIIDNSHNGSLSISRMPTDKEIAKNGPPPRLILEVTKFVEDEEFRIAREDELAKAKAEQERLAQEKKDNAEKSASAAKQVADNFDKLVDGKLKPNKNATYIWISSSSSQQGNDNNGLNASDILNVSANWYTEIAGKQSVAFSAPKQDEFEKTVDYQNRIAKLKSSYDSQSTKDINEKYGKRAAILNHMLMQQAISSISIDDLKYNPDQEYFSAKLAINGTALYNIKINVPQNEATSKKEILLQSTPIMTIEYIERSIDADITLNFASPIIVLVYYSDQPGKDQVFETSATLVDSSLSNINISKNSVAAFKVKQAAEEKLANEKAEKEQAQQAAARQASLDDLESKIKKSGSLHAGDCFCTSKTGALMCGNTALRYSGKKMEQFGCLLSNENYKFINPELIDDGKVVRFTTSKGTVFYTDINSVSY